MTVPISCPGACITGIPGGSRTIVGRAEAAVLFSRRQASRRPLRQSLAEPPSIVVLSGSLRTTRTDPPAGA